MQANIHQRVADARARYEAAEDALLGFRQGLGRPHLLEKLERDLERTSLAYEAVLVEFINSRQGALQ